MTTKEVLTVQEYVDLVFTGAEILGYSVKTISCFISDIQDCYYNGDTVEECLEKEF